MPPIVLENDSLALKFDGRGCLTAFHSKLTGTDYQTFPGLEDNWRILVLTSGHPVEYILGRDQTPVAVEQSATSVTFRFRDLIHKGVTYPIEVETTAYLQGDEARFAARVKNDHSHRVREVWYPIVAGFEGYEVAGRDHVVDFAKSRVLERDILNTGLPRAEYLFVVDGETAHYVYPQNMQMQWIDLFCEREGLYLSSDDSSLTTTIFRLEKYPPEYGATGSFGFQEPARFPEDTPRWLTMLIGRLTAIDTGEEWTSAPGVLWPHRGDWHAAARRYRDQIAPWLARPERPAWLDNYVGWHHIVSKTYLGEVYYTFDDFIDEAIKARDLSGVDTLMLYGHTNIGCEGSDYHIGPAEDLGGREGFKRLADALHAEGMKLMVFTHRQSAINVELPEYKQFERWMIQDRLGRPRTEVWWKTTAESLMEAGSGHYEATGPVWTRVCPHCDEWWEGFRDEVLDLMALGLDGIQLDTIGVEGRFCYATDHGHKPGTSQIAKLGERLAWLREELRAVNPEFLICGEEFGDWLSQYLDLPYSRYRGDNGNEVYRFTFPENKENCAVSNYGYYQANKSVLLGMGVDLEMWGLKKSILACPELGEYLKDIVALRRGLPDYLINGRFVDTLSATIEGDVRYSVFEGPNGHAVVLWNPSDETQACTAQFEDSAETGGWLYRLAAEPSPVTFPVSVRLPPQSIAVLVAQAA